MQILGIWIFLDNVWIKVFQQFFKSWADWCVIFKAWRQRNERIGKVQWIKMEEEGVMEMEKMEEEGLHKLSTHLFLPIIAVVAVLQVIAWQGRVAIPNQMNFRKNSKGPSTPPPHLRKIILQFFYDGYWILLHICKELWWPESMKCMHVISREWDHSEGRGSTHVWNLFGNTSVLVPWPVP